MDLDSCDNIFDSVLASQNEAEFCHHIAPLFDIYETLSVGLGRANIFWRARVVDGAKWPNVEDLDYPPPKVARQGRLNDVGSPCFYVAKDIQTALLEIEVKAGQLVQVAGFRVLSDETLRLTVVGEWANVQKNGYMRFTGTDPDRTIQRRINQNSKAPSILYIDEFFASILGNPSARDSDYMQSRALGALLYSKVNADGIAFPSVRDLGGFNLAVKPFPSDRVFHNVACVLVKVGKRRKFSVLDYEIVSSATKLDAQLNFLWPESYQAGHLNIYGMSKQEHDFALNNAADKAVMLDLLSMYSPRNARGA